MYTIQKHILLWCLTLLMMVPMAASAQDEVVAETDSIVTTWQMKLLRRQERELRKIESHQDDGPSVWAVHANMLRWITFTPELGVAWRPTLKWEYLVVGAWTTLSWHYLDRRYALWTVSTEARRRIGQKGRWYVGGQLEFGQHHYKFTETGREGEVYGFGFTGGWQRRLSRHMYIDLHIGAGVDFSNFDAYDLEPSWDKLQLYRTYLNEEHKAWLGLNQLGVNIVWELPFQKGGRP